MRMAILIIFLNYNDTLLHNNKKDRQAAVGVFLECVGKKFFTCGKEGVDGTSHVNGCPE